MNDWQPIETAPKDEDTQVLVWDGEAVSVAKRSFSDWHGTIEGKLISEAGDGMLTYLKPTHWMPLPVPPAKAYGSSERPKGGVILVGFGGNNAIE